MQFILIDTREDFLCLFPKEHLIDCKEISLNSDLAYFTDLDKFLRITFRESEKYLACDIYS